MVDFSMRCNLSTRNEMIQEEAKFNNLGDGLVIKSDAAEPAETNRLINTGWVMKW